MIVNYKIGKIKLELLKEEFIKQIKDSYTLNLSMVLLEEFENLQQQNKKQQENIKKAVEYIKWQYENPTYDNVWRKFEVEELLSILEDKEVSE